MSELLEQVRGIFVALGNDFDIDLTTEPGWVTCSIKRADEVIALVESAQAPRSIDAHDTKIELEARGANSYLIDGTA